MDFEYPEGDSVYEFNDMDFEFPEDQMVDGFTFQDAQNSVAGIIPHLPINLPSNFAY